ncbi:hypothetical protein PPACK8108_LOCUS2533 [Phakopsora pachyrhizi]|uniref:Uncharacterized protein n=1 Tax=Phakopsora pachyrhizi TaxID=170000 RepID=A0AAV0AJP8_PHAPC|nr:hypothetical protein PPACK8108_LOCUS2533 [Phakopsora pachyrhizi]
MGLRQGRLAGRIDWLGLGRLVGRIDWLGLDRIDWLGLDRIDWLGLDRIDWLGLDRIDWLGLDRSIGLARTGQGSFPGRIDWLGQNRAGQIGLGRLAGRLDRLGQGRAAGAILTDFDGLGFDIGKKLKTPAGAHASPPNLAQSAWVYLAILAKIPKMLGMFVA